jgi:MerR family transcriptional regulator, light-induced transcriptional regulator
MIGPERSAARAVDDVPGEGDDPQLSIQQASSLLNLPAPTIRSWERRYAVPAPDRSSGGHRRYSAVQVETLRRMRDLIVQGRRPIEAAGLVTSGYAAAPGPLVDAYLDAARELAPDRIARTLDVAHETLGLERTVDEVLVPAMRAIGEGWRAGRIDVAHEHLATTAARAWLSNLAAPGRRRPEPPIILSCGPYDHHTLGLEAFGALLRQRSCDCRLLGARTPTESLALAVEETNAVAVVLVCHVTAGRPAAIEALRSSRLRRPLLFYAGGGFSSHRARHGVPGHYLGTHFAHAADLVSHTITSATAERPH